MAELDLEELDISEGLHCFLADKTVDPAARDDSWGLYIKQVREEGILFELHTVTYVQGARSNKLLELKSMKSSMSR